MCELIAKIRIKMLVNRKLEITVAFGCFECLSALVLLMMMLMYICTGASASAGADTSIFHAKWTSRKENLQKKNECEIAEPNENNKKKKRTHNGADRRNKMRHVQKFKRNKKKKPNKYLWYSMHRICNKQNASRSYAFIEKKKHCYLHRRIRNS